MFSSISQWVTEQFHSHLLFTNTKLKSQWCKGVTVFLNVFKAKNRRAMFPIQKDIHNMLFY